MISIIIPTLNEEKAIGTTLRQIKDHLTDYPYEIIVADSKSGDRTAEIAREYATVVETERGKTIAWNRNRGADHAKGDFIVYVDADVTVPEPNAFFKTALDDFARDPKLVAITCNLDILPANATVTDRVMSWLVNQTVRFNNNALHTGAAPGEFQMIRRSAFDAVHGYKEHLVVTEDNDMFMRLARIGRTRFEHRLHVYQTGRRVHATGWPRLLWQWLANYFSYLFLNRSYDKKWKEVR